MKCESCNEVVSERVVRSFKKGGKKYKLCYLCEYLMGRRVKVVSGNEYLNKTGKIEFCDKCCHDFRIQFDGIANNEPLEKYRKHLVFID